MRNKLCKTLGGLVCVLGIQTALAGDPGFGKGKNVTNNHAGVVLLQPIQPIVLRPIDDLTDAQKLYRRFTREINQTVAKLRRNSVLINPAKRGNTYWELETHEKMLIQFPCPVTIHVVHWRLMQRNSDWFARFKFNESIFLNGRPVEIVNQPRMVNSGSSYGIFSGIVNSGNDRPNYPGYDMHSVDRRMQPTLAEQVQNNRNNQHNNHWIQQENGRWTI